MEQTTENLPSVKDLEKGGISLKINQSDIIDLIVSGKIQELQKEIEDFMQRTKDIKKLYNDHREEVMNEIGEKIFILIKSSFPENESVSVEFIGTSTGSNYYSKPSTTITSLSNISTASQFRFEEIRETLVLKDTVSVAFNVKICTKDLLGNPITLVLRDKCADSSEIDLAPKGFQKLVSDYEQDVKEFLQKFQNFNYANVKRSIKAEFTKKILEESPAEFKKSLLENFNIAI